jgi:hypothetical protein
VQTWYFANPFFPDRSQPILYTDQFVAGTTQYLSIPSYREHERWHTEGVDKLILIQARNQGYQITDGIKGTHNQAKEHVQKARRDIENLIRNKRPANNSRTELHRGRQELEAILNKYFAGNGLRAISSAGRYHAVLPLNHPARQFHDIHYRWKRAIPIPPPTSGPVAPGAPQVPS